MRRHLAVAVLLLSLIAVPNVFAGSTIEFDIRNEAEPFPPADDIVKIPRLYVVFAARDPRISPAAIAADKFSPGHTYVVWGVENPEKKVSEVDAYGFYMTGGTVPKAIIGTVPGALLDEIGDDFRVGGLSTSEHRMIMRVDKEQWDNTRKVLDTWKKKDSYKLGQDDCITFMQAVGTALKIPMPVRGTDLPPTYLERVITQATSPNKLGLGTNGSIMYSPTRHTGTTRLDVATPTMRERIEFPASGKLGSAVADREFVNGELQREELRFAHGDLSVSRLNPWSRAINTQQWVRNGDGVGYNIQQFKQYPDGSTYVGETFDGEPWGRGTLTDHSGVSRYGWYDGKKLLKPAPIALGGGWYEGPTKNGLPEGIGTYQRPDGTWYRGGFSSGRYQGNGTYKWPDGRVYSGEFADGRIKQVPNVAEGSGGTRGAGHEAHEHMDGRPPKDEEKDLVGHVTEFDKDGNKIGEREIRGMEITSKKE